MGCNSCGIPKIDALLSKLPGTLTPSMFNSILMQAPKVYDEEIRVQPDQSPSIFTSLLTSRTFVEQGTEYSELRLTKSAGIQFYDNNQVFRKAYSRDNCAPGCVWNPKSFDAGRETVTSELLVADFEQEVPCYDNMLKSYEFVKFFLQVPDMLNGYMDRIASQFVRNELVNRSKKIVLTTNKYRSNLPDVTCFPNLLQEGTEDLVFLGDLTPSVLTSFYDELTSLHPDVRGYQQSGGMQTFGLMIDPGQWRLKQLTDPLYKEFIINNPQLSSEFFKRFMVHETFAEMFAILPTKELPRADINAAGTVVYHHRYIDVPTGSGGVKRVGNPGYANADYGVALILPSELGFLWEEQPLPVKSIGDVKFGPMFGQTDLGNGKWAYLPHYDYYCNPLGKGGKWIAQYKTGFHPGPGMDGLYAILYPLTKYSAVRSQVPLAPCFVSREDTCTDNFVTGGCPCPMVKFCCNISATEAVFKTDVDLGVVVDDVFNVVYDDASVQAVTALAVTEENGLFIYRVSSVTPIKCNCVKDFECGVPEVVCYSKVLSQSDAKSISNQWGLQLESCFVAPVATSTIITYGDGTTVTLPVLSIETVNRNGVLIPYHYFALTYENIVEKGTPTMVRLAAAGCDAGDVIIPCTPIEPEEGEGE